MASSSGNVDIFLEEFEDWQKSTSSEDIFLLESESLEDGSAALTMLLGGEYEFKLTCPAGYPNHTDTFFVSSNVGVSIWANSLNEFLIDSPTKLTLSEALNKALFFHSTKRESTGGGHTSEDDMSVDEDEEYDYDDVSMNLSDDDSAFTTEWELKVARKKKRWIQKEKEIREQLTKTRLNPGSTDQLAAFQASGQEREQAKQIFTSTAASGILTNDLVKIMESEKDVGFSAEPVDDNIYQWHVTLFDFDKNSDLSKDLKKVNEKFGYECIELLLDFAIDLYPFYPPLVKVIRPRLQDSMMQRVTNMELLKLSYWNAAKDMMSVLVDIKHFLQQWARLEVSSERNDKKRYPNGSYVNIEHHLLRLALVSEVNPRANIKFQLNIDKPPDMKPSPITKDTDKKKEEYWASGVGFGHNQRSGWDINAYVAAQKEKDKQVETVLHKIHKELKVLYHNHAPQLKPRYDSSRLLKSADEASNSSLQSSVSDESIDPVEDMYNILEGSALIPFLEQYLKADSFLEICRHTSVYKAIVDIIKELAMQAQLLPLCGPLPNQATSLYQLLQLLDQKATTLLQHICKAGNGSIPKTRSHSSSKSSSNNKKQKHKHDKDKDKDKSHHSHHHHHTSSAHATYIPKLMLGGGGSSSSSSSSGSGTGHVGVVHFPPVSISGPTGSSSAPIPVLAGSVVSSTSSTGGGSSSEGGVYFNNNAGISTNKELAAMSHEYVTSSSMEKSAEERLAREFQVLFKDVTEAFTRTGQSPSGVSESESGSDVNMEVIVSIDEYSDLESKYKKLISELQFLQHEIDCEGCHAHHYSSDYKKQPAPSQRQVFRIAQEYSSLATSLPLDLSSCVCIRTDDEKLTLARALITGPEGTPYSSGCFIFDIYFPPNYPKSPPNVNLQTTGGGTVRFNPNLYNCGKVCLSLLGTWEGQQGEQWNEKTSTILQVLVSIQSLILVSEPYFNEPGYEKEIGTEAGNRFSADYNQNVQINNIKYAMIGLLQEPTPGFEDVIKTHFYLKKERILQEVEGWVKQSKSNKLERTVNNLKQELNKLQAPPNVVNLVQPPTAASTPTNATTGSATATSKTINNTSTTQK